MDNVCGNEAFLDTEYSNVLSFRVGGGGWCSGRPLWWFSLGALSLSLSLLFPLLPLLAFLPFPPLPSSCSFPFSCLLSAPLSLSLAAFSMLMAPDFA